MKIDPISLLLDKNLKLDKKFYFISGNEITLIDKISKLIIENFKSQKNFSILQIDTMKGMLNNPGLFSDQNLFVGKNCKDINQENLDKVNQDGDVFIFIQENSTKIKGVKNMFSKRGDSFLIECYDLNKDSKIKLLNNFIKINEIKIDEDLYWILIDKLDNRYIFFENTLNRILQNKKVISLEEVKKLLTIDDTGKDRLFFNILNKNYKIVEIYRDKILSISDVNELFYYCKFYCQMIIDSKNEQDYLEKIPKYLFREKAFLIGLYRKYNDKKKRMLLDLLVKTERLLRRQSSLSIVTGLRFFLNVKKITIS